MKVDWSQDSSPGHASSPPNDGQKGPEDHIGRTNSTGFVWATPETAEARWWIWGHECVCIVRLRPQTERHQAIHRPTNIGKLTLKT